MRKWMYETVISCPGQAEFSGGRVMSSGGVSGDEGVGDSPTRPFIVIRAATNQPPLDLGGGAGIKQQRYQLFLHKDPSEVGGGASMVSTDSLCKSLEDHIPGQAPLKTNEGVVIDARWEDTSGDGFDDHYQTTTRYVTFLVTYKPAP